MKKYTKALPTILRSIEIETKNLGFNMASVPETGILLKILASTMKPSSKFLELGTGTGLSTAWILDGMDRSSSLVSVDNDRNAISIAKKHLGHDKRVQFIEDDGTNFVESLHQNNQEGYDFIFADTWAGKYHHLEDILNKINPGGLYVIDDMSPQENWPTDHPPKVKSLIEDLYSRSDFNMYNVMNWSTGIIIGRKEDIIPNLHKEDTVRNWLLDNINSEGGVLSENCQNMFKESLDQINNPK